MPAHDEIIGRLFQSIPFHALFFCPSCQFTGSNHLIRVPHFRYAMVINGRAHLLSPYLKLFGSTGSKGNMYDFPGILAHLLRKVSFGRRSLHPDRTFCGRKMRQKFRLIKLQQTAAFLTYLVIMTLCSIVSIRHSFYRYLASLSFLPQTIQIVVYSSQNHCGIRFLQPAKNLLHRHMSARSFHNLQDFFHIWS